MKLTEVVAQHGFIPSKLAEINNAKLYSRQNIDGVTELLCVQKIGNVMRVDRMPLVELSPGILLPIGDGISNQVLPREDIEHYLNTTLVPIQGAHM